MVRKRTFQRGNVLQNKDDVGKKKEGRGMKTKFLNCLDFQIIFV